MPFDPIAYSLAKRSLAKAISWEDVKNKLKEEGALNKAYDSNLDGIIELSKIPTITREKLEYPTSNVSFAYLSSINKINFDIVAGGAPKKSGILITIDSFTDKAVKCQCLDYTGIFGRFVDLDNFYNQCLYSPSSGYDHQLWKSASQIGAESVDIDSKSRHLLKLSISGSTIKCYRNDMSTPKFSVTDSSYSSGSFGVEVCSLGGNYNTSSIFAILLDPSSPSPKALAIIECEVTNNKPNLKSETIEIEKLNNIPEFLKNEYKIYKILKEKFTDEEINLILGHTPQTHIDVASITWGSFDYKPNDNTMLIMIYSDNPYKRGAIHEQIEHAKRKNLITLKPPKDYREVIEQYKQLKKEFTNWTAGKDNYAFQVLGYQELDYFQIADTYYGNIIDGLKPDAYKNVPDWEMRRTLNMWKEKLEKVNVLKEEAEKHLKKLEEVMKKGW